MAWSGTCGTNLTATLDDNGLLTISKINESGTGEMTDWGNMSSVAWYYSRSSIKTIKIEEGVTTIGNNAFYDCSYLTSVDLPDSLEIIGATAFRDCKRLTSITIPKGVTTIGNHAFCYCNELTEIIIPDNVISIGEQIFYGCQKLKKATIGNGLKSTGNYAFYDCISLTSITIGTNIETIGAQAFYNCDGLTQIVIPDSVTTIGNHAFYHCSNLTSITIPDSVKYIYNNAFNNCIKLEIATIGNGVKNIYQNVFYDCTALTSIEIPESVKTIDQNAFYNCTNLSNVYYGGSRSQWNDIGINSSGNTELIADDVTFYFYKGECGSNLNYEFDRVDTLIIRGTGEMYNYNINSLPLWDGYKEKIKEIIVKEGVLSIGKLAFSNCTNVTSVSIENSVVSINEYAFTKCTNLNNIEISDSVKTINDNAFSDCNNLSTVDYKGTQKQWNNVVIGSNNEPLIQANIIFLEYKGSCGDNLIYDFDGLGTITIVGEGDMYDYNTEDNLSPWSVHKENIKIVIFPKFITKIGDNAFSDCDNLATVNYKGSQIEWDNVNKGDNNDSLTQANITFFEIKLSHYLTKNTDMTTLNDLIDYANAKSQEGYKFVVYYSSVEEKKKIIEFRINNDKENEENDKEFETYYIGEKGKLNINFDKVEECYLEKELFVNRKIDFLNIPGRDGNRISGMAKGTLTGSIINQLSIPYIGANSTADETCNYFTWLFGEDKFISPNIQSDKNVEKGSPINNLPNEVVINSKSIPAYAFSWCNIKAIDLPNDLVEVGEYAFYQIGSEALDIPKNLKEIGDYAFYSEKLQKINWISYLSTKKNNDKYQFDLGEQGNYFYLKKNDYSDMNLLNNEIVLKDWKTQTSDLFTSEIKTNETENYLQIITQKDDTYNLSNIVVKPYYYQMFEAINTNSIIYTYAKIRGYTTNVKTPKMYLGYGGAAEPLSNIIFPRVSCIEGDDTNLNDSKWHTLSGCFIVDSNLKTTYINSVAVTIGNRESGFKEIKKGDTMDIKEVCVFNLTEIFGAGNEPTKEWCDKVLAEKNNILYPEINSIKFLDERGKQAEDITEAEDSEYTFDYKNGLVKKSDDVVGYFSLPYYIFASKLNVGRYPHFVENNGSCGKDLDWFLNTKTDENGNEYYSLNISGIGDMFDFSTDSPPWKGSESKIKEIILSEKITSIGDYAFKGCSITTFKCPQNLETIGAHSFEDCSNLEEVIFSDKIEDIGDYAFKGCKMQIVVLPDSIKDIGKYAFSYNSRLEKVDASKVANSVGEGCFSFCSNLESLSLPFVGETASATGLKGIIGHVVGGESSDSFEASKYETVTQIYTNVLNKVTSVKTQEYKIPISLKEIYIKNGDIRVGAFSGMSKVEKIIIEDATSMDINIFWGADNLKEIKVPYKELKQTPITYTYINGNFSSIASGAPNLSYWRYNNFNFIERLFYCGTETTQNLYGSELLKNSNLTLTISNLNRGASRDSIYIYMPSIEKITITNANLSQIGSFSDWQRDNLNFDLNLPDNTEILISAQQFKNSNINNLNLNTVPTVFNKECFYSSKIKKINNLTWGDLFSNTTKIYQDAFYGKNFDEDSDEIVSLVFSKLTNIYSYAFRNVQANSVKISCSPSMDIYSFAESLIKEIEIDGAINISSYAFYNCVRLTHLKFYNIKMISNCILANNPELEEITTPFIGQNPSPSNVANPTYSFMQWFHLLGTNTSSFYTSNFNYPYKGTNFNAFYATSYKLPKLKKIIITGDSKYIPKYMFYDVKRWFTSLEGIYFTNLASSDVGNVETAFYVYQDDNNKAVKVDKYWYFSDQFDAGEILPVSSYRMSSYSDNNYSSEENLIDLRENEQRVIKLLSDKDYSWKALLYGKDYDVYITDNNTYADGSSYLPTLYLPNNSRMEQGQQITLIGENTYNITDLEDFSCSNKIFYRQSKGILNGKLSYFNTVTGMVTKSNGSWIITDENFKASIKDVPVNFTIGSVYDSNHIDGTVKIVDGVITIEQLDTDIDINEGLTITIEKALVTEGSIDANLINVIREGSKFTTSADGQLQTVNGKPENYYNIKFTPGFYVGDNGYNNVNITVADETLILPNDLLSNTVLLSIETHGKLTLEGTTGDNVKKGIISENLIGIIKKGVTYFNLNNEVYIIKDIDRTNNQVVFENEKQNGFVLESETVEYDIELKNYIDISIDKEENLNKEEFDVTDLHLTLNHINIFDVESIKKYKGLETSSILKDGEILYLITTKEPINPKDYEVLERSLEKVFTLERYTTIATVETIDKSNVQHILVYPDTFYEIKSNCIETPQYYFQTSEKQDTIFYVNDEKIEKDLLTDQNIKSLESSSAKITAKYQGNLIWYKWTIQENMDGEYYTIKEFVEYYNPNIILNYDLFRNNTEYRLILTTKTKEDLEVNAYLYINVNYGIDSLDKIVIDKDCVEKAIKISFLDTKNKFLFDTFITEGKYEGIEYIYVGEEDKKLYVYTGDEEYLFYNNNVSYNKDYTFSYKVTTVGNVAIRFYNSSNKNISENVVEVIKDGFYNSKLNAIVVEGSTELLIPYNENLNVSYFNVGFYAPKDSYFSEMQLEVGLGKTEFEEGVLTFAEKGIRSFIVLREDVDDENSLCKLGEVKVDAKYFYDYSFNRELTYQYYIVPVFFDYINGNDGLIYGPPHKLNNQINYNLKEVTLIDTVIDITPDEEVQSFNTYEANKQEYSMWHFKYNTDAKSINVVTDKTVYETTMKIPIVNKTNRNYKTGTIKAFLGGFVKENNKLTYRDSIKLQNKFQEFCDNGRVKMLRDEIGNVLPVDVTLTSFEYNPHTIPTNITVTFEWTQVGEEDNLSVWRSE